MRQREKITQSRKKEDRAYDVRSAVRISRSEVSVG